MELHHEIQRVGKIEQFVRLNVSAQNVELRKETRESDERHVQVDDADEQVAREDEPQVSVDGRQLAPRRW